MLKYERMWRAKKTKESQEAFRQQTQKLNQLIRTVKEEYYAIHGGGPVSCLSYWLHMLLYCIIRILLFWFVEVYIMHS